MMEQMKDIILHLKYIKKVLKKSDKESRKERALRKFFVNKYIDDCKYRIWINSYPNSEDILNESLNSYISGNYISTVMLSQALIEKMIRQEFNTNLGKLDYPSLLSKAQEIGLIESDEEYKAFADRSSNIRNAYVHYPRNRRQLRFKDEDTRQLEARNALLDMITIYNRINKDR
jgi:hypothetical protein